MDKEVNLLGKNNVKYSSEFKVRVNKLTKQERNPVLWVGFANMKLAGGANIQKNRDAEIIAMSDQHKLYDVDRFVLHYRLQPGSY